MVLRPKPPSTGSEAESEILDAGESPEPGDHIGSVGESAELADAESPEPSPPAEKGRISLDFDAGEDKYEEDFDDESVEETTEPVEAETPEIGSSPHGSKAGSEEPIEAESPDPGANKDNTESLSPSPIFKAESVSPTSGFQAESVSPSSVVFGPDETSTATLVPGGADQEPESGVTLDEKPQSARSVEEVDQTFAVADDMARCLSRELVWKSTDQRLGNEDGLLTYDGMVEHTFGDQKLDTSCDAMVEVTSAEDTLSPSMLEEAVPSKPGATEEPAAAKASDADFLRKLALATFATGALDGSLQACLTSQARDQVGSTETRSTTARADGADLQGRAKASELEEIRAKAKSAMLRAADDGSLPAMLAAPAKPQEAQVDPPSSTEQMRESMRTMLEEAFDSGKLHLALETVIGKPAPEAEASELVQAEAYVGSTAAAQQEQIDRDVVIGLAQNSRPKTSDSSVTGILEINMDSRAGSPSLVDDDVDNAVICLIETSLQAQAFSEMGLSPETVLSPEAVAVWLEFDPASRSVEPAMEPVVEPVMEPVPVESDVVEVTQRMLRSSLIRVNEREAHAEKVEAERGTSQRAGPGVDSQEAVARADTDRGSPSSGPQSVETLPQVNFRFYYQMHVLPAASQNDYFVSLHQAHFQRASQEASQEAKPEAKSELQNKPKDVELDDIRQKLRTSLLKSYEEGELARLADSVKSAKAHGVESGDTEVGDKEMALAPFQPKSNIEADEANIRTRAKAALLCAAEDGTLLEALKSTKRETTKAALLGAAEDGTLLEALKSTKRETTKAALLGAAEDGTLLEALKSTKRETEEVSDSDIFTKAAATLVGAAEDGTLLQALLSNASPPTEPQKPAMVTDVDIFEKAAAALISAAHAGALREVLASMPSQEFESELAAGDGTLTNSAMAPETWGPVCSQAVTMPREAWEKLYEPFASQPSLPDKPRSEEESAQQAAKQLILKSALTGRLQEVLPKHWLNAEKVKEEQAEKQQRATQRQQRADDEHKARCATEQQLRKDAHLEINGIRQTLAKRERSARAVQAAVRIQRHARGVLAQKETENMCAMNVAVEATTEWMHGLEMQVATVQIQKAARQSAARKEVARQREQRQLEAAQVRAEVCSEALRAVGDQAVQNANAAVDELASSACSDALLRGLYNAEVREVRSAQSARSCRRHSGSRGARVALRLVYEQVSNEMAARTCTSCILKKCAKVSESRPSQSAKEASAGAKAYLPHILQKSTDCAETRIASATQRAEREVEVQHAASYTHKAMLKSCHHSEDRFARDFSKRLVVKSCQHSENRDSRSFSRSIILKCCQHAENRESRVLSRSIVMKSCMHSEDRLARVYIQRIVLKGCRKSQDRAARVFSRRLLLKCHAKSCRRVQDRILSRECQPQDIEENQQQSEAAEPSVQSRGELPFELLAAAPEAAPKPEVVSESSVQSRELPFELLAAAPEADPNQATVSEPSVQSRELPFELLAAAPEAAPKPATETEVAVQAPVLTMPVEAWEKIYKPFAVANAPKSGTTAESATAPESVTAASESVAAPELAIVAEAAGAPESATSPESATPPKTTSPTAADTQRCGPLLTMPKEAWEKLYEPFASVPECSSTASPQELPRLPAWTPVLTIPKEAWEKFYEPFSIVKQSSSTEMSQAKEEPTLTRVESQLPTSEAQAPSETEDPGAIKEVEQEAASRSLEGEGFLAAEPEAEASEPVACEERELPSFGDLMDAPEPTAPAEPADVELVERSLRDAYEVEPLDVPGPNKENAQYVSQDVTEFSDASGDMGEQSFDQFETPRADITFYVTLYEQRLARAIMSGEYEPEQCSKSSSRPRFRRPPPGYSLRQHHNREEARVASLIYGRDLTTENAGENQEMEAEDNDSASLRPQRPAGPNPNARRPGPRRAKPVDPPSPAAGVEAWTPLRGSDSTAQLLPKAPAQPPPAVEAGRRLRRPRAQGTPMNHSRFVFTFPVPDEKAPVAVSADDVSTTVPDDDSHFRATVSSLRSTGGVNGSHSVPPLSLTASKHASGWSSEWVVQNSKPWPPRYHVGLPPLRKGAASPPEAGESPHDEDDAHAEMQASLEAGEPSASALDNAREQASPGLNSNGSDDAANPVRHSLAVSRPSRAAAHGGAIKVSPSSERARIHLPPVRQMRFAPLTLKSKRESSVDIPSLDAEADVE